MQTVGGENANVSEEFRGQMLPDSLAVPESAGAAVCSQTKIGKIQETNLEELSLRLSHLILRYERILLPIFIGKETEIQRCYVTSPSPYNQ